MGIRKITLRFSKSQGGKGKPDPVSSQPGSNWKDPAQSTASKMAGDASDRATPWGAAACSTIFPTTSKRKNNEKPNAPDEPRGHKLQDRTDATARPKDKCA